MTDLYQLTMNAAYVEREKDGEATFELFIRKLPKDWGYFIANGVEDAINYATNIHFTKEHIDYLRKQGLFSQRFLDFLKGFKFEGDIWTVREGTPVFPNTPILRVTGNRTQSQFLETLLLNTINFQTMITSKSSRIVNAANGRTSVEFGLRRAQEMDAAMKGARASYIAGFAATSNVLAGMEYGIPISGTHAHSFVMSFPTELEAFRAYAKTFPNNPTFLIDTYDVEQGARNAVVVGKELELNGGRLGAVRLDSGDLCQDSQKVRRILDEAGLTHVKVVASNDLNEYRIAELLANGAKIDAFGVGTENITAKPVAAIPGVYKLVEDGEGVKMKFSSEKKSYPGKKQVFRVSNEDGTYAYDTLGLEGENILGSQPLLELVVKNGKRVSVRRSLEETRKYCLELVEKLPRHLKEVVVTTPYELRISSKLDKLTKEVVDKLSSTQVRGST